MLPLLAAALAGAAVGDGACRLAAFRDFVGRAAGRGHLVALVGSNGVYQSDVHRRAAETGWRSGDESNENTGDARNQLVAEAVALLDTRLDKIAPAGVEREAAALEGQLGSRAAWLKGLGRNGLNEARFSKLLGDNLRVRRWIDDRIANATSATESECRRYFENNRREFTLPPRFRVAHLFLAANSEVAPEIVETKRQTIRQLSELIKHGKRLSELVPMFTDDEATKATGGDLGYVARFRMPEDFISAVERLRAGQTSEPVQTRLGFHILQLIDAKPQREMSFDEVRPEIVARLRNTRRLAAVHELVNQLTGSILIP